MSSIPSLVLFVLAALGAGDKPVAPIDRALEAFRAGEYAKVVVLAGEVTAGSPDEPRALYLAGRAEVELRRPAQAAAAFEKVLALRPAAVPALVGLASARTLEEKYGEAEKLLRQAVAADAKDTDARRMLGELLMRIDRLADARKEIAQAYALDPKDPFVARSWVEVLLRNDELGVALRVADAFGRARPKHPTAFFLRGLCLERDGKDNAAIEAYEKVLALDDNYLDAHKNLAILCHTRNAMYQDFERTRKAFAHYERYFALGGKDPELEQIYKTAKEVLAKFMKF